MSTFIRKEADYALRIAVYLAGTGSRVKMQDLCLNLGLTRPVVAKVVQDLKRHHIITSRTGRHGGLSLAASPENLSVYDVLAAMNSNSSLNTCLDDPQFCRLQAICRISDFLCQLQQEFFERLRQVPLSDLVFDELQLSTLVQHHATKNA